MKPIPKIGITLGDPAGIGPEILLKAYRQRLPSHFPIIFGDLSALENAAQSVPPPSIKILTSLSNPLLLSGEGINLFPVTKLSPTSILPGRTNAETGKAAGLYIEAAIHAALRHKIDAVVTCPIHKQAFHQGGYAYPGHTEMFASLTGTRHFAMMMVSHSLKVSLVTIHLPLSRVPKEITPDRIEATLDLTLQTMRSWFGVEDPKIGVLGLNPHAGEGGDIGREEIEMISPLVRTFRNRGWNVEGPLPPDTAFTKKSLGSFDAFVAMYHDQGLIPFKLIAFKTGVNCTLGLPFPRVSVDHGTGLDISGKGIADPSSLRSAIRWAVKFAKTKRKD